MKRLLFRAGVPRHQSRENKKIGLIVRRRTAQIQRISFLKQRHLTPARHARPGLARLCLCRVLQWANHPCL